MKKILITGINSYVGNSFENWVVHRYKNYSIDKISLRKSDWVNLDFSKYDVILHVAGIAHVSTKENMKDLYYKINRDLTERIAKKAKNENVKQFIFLSSIIVYGKENGTININTVPNPDNFYGESKLQAEKLIQSLHSENFRVAIVRPPMIYGKGSKGNFQKLSKLASIVPFFPQINNHRSMLHIDNLSEFLVTLIKNQDSGIYFPQNREYINTTDLVSTICVIKGKKVYLTRAFNPLIFMFLKKSNILSKMFGDLKYDLNMSVYKEDYICRDYLTSIRLTEMENESEN
ncbi:NAD-dependent epimerase/dehydratase family protein [Rossellomorea marisflavi]|uniref:NAD-dependent epimerase/dehydratase family protein n=1 Tax=Rossellomorea marisflavi TaxID=189381 RepID=UPI00345B2C53